MSSAGKAKGARIEREVVELHMREGILAKKVPLSGALGGEYYGDVHIFPSKDIKMTAEVKSRKNGAGFAVIEGWLGDNQLLFLRRNNTEHLVCMPFKVYIELMKAYANKN